MAFVSSHLIEISLIGIYFNYVKIQVTLKLLQAIIFQNSVST